MKLTPQEHQIFKRLNTPIKIQDYLDSLKINFEEEEETCSSPRMVLKRKSAHCIEAALLAAAILLYHKQRPFLLDLKANNRDYDHVVCMFKKNNLWGAISKSNHVTLRYRDPIYKSARELALSYFNEYHNDFGEKTLKSYSQPFSLNSYDLEWVISQNDLWLIANELDKFKHNRIVPRGLVLRKADKLEIAANNLTEWSRRPK